MAKYRKFTKSFGLLAPPDLLKEWHPTKNGKKKPEDYSPGSNVKIWWKCSKGHEWQSIILHRFNGSHCPYCQNKVPCEDNCLATINPELAKEWHPSKNGDFTPKDVVPKSQKKAWWICKKGHQWQAALYHRSRGQGCPYCTGVKVCDDNCLATNKPALAKEWHTKKNGKLTPKDVVAGSRKTVWWKCSKGHEWQAVIHNRPRCPICRKFEQSSK
ncbi:MAG: zinc-ribbon domain-containing protein [Spirochaetales bacterium]|nr:zinc-ribbon domain-containing protein [Spirochaetales bacterium]